MPGSREIALDTNIVVEHLRYPGRHDANLAAYSLHLSATVLAELYAGSARSANPERNKNGINAFLATCTLLRSDENTAEIYGDIWADLARNGSLIPTNDIWIAAAAIQHHLKLVTSDSHFEKIDGLEIERW